MRISYACVISWYLLRGLVDLKSIHCLFSSGRLSGQSGFIRLATKAMYVLVILHFSWIYEIGRQSSKRQRAVDVKFVVEKERRERIDRAPMREPDGDTERSIRDGSWKGILGAGATTDIDAHTVRAHKMPIASSGHPAHPVRSGARPRKSRGRLPRDRSISVRGLFSALKRRSPGPRAKRGDRRLLRLASSVPQVTRFESRPFGAEPRTYCIFRCPLSGAGGSPLL